MKSDDKNDYQLCKGESKDVILVFEYFSVPIDSSGLGNGALRIIFSIMVHVQDAHRLVAINIWAN